MKVRLDFKGKPYYPEGSILVKIDGSDKLGCVWGGTRSVFKLETKILTDLKSNLKEGLPK